MNLTFRTWPTWVSTSYILPLLMMTVSRDRPRETWRRRASAPSIPHRSPLKHVLTGDRDNRRVTGDRWGVPWMLGGLAQLTQGDHFVGQQQHRHQHRRHLTTATQPRSGTGTGTGTGTGAELRNLNGEWAAPDSIRPRASLLTRLLPAPYIFDSTTSSYLIPSSATHLRTSYPLPSVATALPVRDRAS